VPELQSTKKTLWR